MAKKASKVRQSLKQRRKDRLKSVSEAYPVSPKKSELAAAKEEYDSAVGKLEPVNTVTDIEPQVVPHTNTERQELFGIAATILSIAAGIGVLIGVSTIFLPEGKEAVTAIAGLGISDVSSRSVQIAFLLDTLFPLFYGAGIILLVSAFQRRGNRPLVRLILTGLLFAVIADFAENGLVLSSVSGGEQSMLLWPLTVIKYGLIALVGILISSLLDRSEAFSSFISLLLRYLFPIAIGVLVSRLAGENIETLIGASFPILLFLLAAYSNSKSSHNT